MTTILTDAGVAEVSAGEGAKGTLWVEGDVAARAIGWELKPEGLCRGEVCVPLPAGRAAEFVRGGEVELAAFWKHMGKPVLSDAAGEVWSLGEGAVDRAAQLASLEAPDFELPDLDGKPHRLSDHRGKKVLLASWASW
jgi:hypothetical protein